MNISLRRYGIGLFLLTLIASSQAQSFRLGFVKTERIFQEASAAKAAQALLEQEFSKREKELIDQTAQLKSMVDKFQLEAPTLTEAQRVSHQRELTDLDRELQRKRRTFQEDLTARKNEQLQQVLESANKAVKQVAETEKYDLILQDAVYANPKLDITDKVLKLLNAQAVK